MEDKKDYNEERSCSNCKFFSQYYVKLKTYYQKAGCGNCLSPKIKYGRIMKRLPYACGCEFWEPNENIDRREAIENSLIKMSERISDILEILKAEKPE